jgi:DHA2 family multidrug resistance protein
MRGTLDAFVLVFYGFLVMIPLILFLKKPAPEKGENAPPPVQE